MTTTPETIAELKRLLAESTPRNGTLLIAAVNALPSLLADLEAAQKVIKASKLAASFLNTLAGECHDSPTLTVVVTARPIESIVAPLNAALAATEVQP